MTEETVVFSFKKVFLLMSWISVGEKTYKRLLGWCTHTFPQVD